jgi:hypothetical protein
MKPQANQTYLELIKKVDHADRGFCGSSNEPVVYEWDLSSRDPVNRYVMVLKAEAPMLATASKVTAVELVCRSPVMDFSKNPNKRQQGGGP